MIQSYERPDKFSCPILNNTVSIIQLLHGKILIIAYKYYVGYKYELSH